MVEGAAGVSPWFLYRWSFWEGKEYKIQGVWSRKVSLKHDCFMFLHSEEMTGRQQSQHSLCVLKLVPRIASPTLPAHSQDAAVMGDYAWHQIVTGGIVCSIMQASSRGSYDMCSCVNASTQSPFLGHNAETQDFPA